MPAGGLFSTAHDLVAVLPDGPQRRHARRQALPLRGGGQADDLDRRPATSPPSYGFGWSVLKKENAGDGRSAGSFGHGGAYKTMMWVDPPKQLVMILLRHQASGFLTPDGNKIEGTFFKAAIEKYGK